MKIRIRTQLHLALCIHDIRNCHCELDSHLRSGIAWVVIITVVLRLTFRYAVDRRIPHLHDHPPSNLEAGLSPAKVAHLMNIPYSTIYTYYKYLQDYGEMTPPRQGKLGAPKAMSVYMEDVCITILYIT